MNSAVAGIASKYGSAPLEFIAPRTASRSAVALPAAAGYRPCSAVSRDGVAAVAGFQKRQTLLASHECGITPRSSGAPTAGHQARSGGTLYIFANRARAPHRWCRLNSNVMPHTKHLSRALFRFGRQHRRTEDKTRAAVATTKSMCPQATAASSASKQADKATRGYPSTHHDQTWHDPPREVKSSQCQRCRGGHE